MRDEVGTKCGICGKPIDAKGGRVRVTFNRTQQQPIKDFCSFTCAVAVAKELVGIMENACTLEDMLNKQAEDTFNKEAEGN